MANNSKKYFDVSDIIKKFINANDSFTIIKKDDYDYHQAINAIQLVLLYVLICINIYFAI